MDALKKNWKAILAAFLLVTALLIFLLGYRPAKIAFEAEETQLNTTIMATQTTITENLKYSQIQNQLEEEMKKIEDSRTALYKHFPKELREEDQIMYILYLEKLFGNEINFSFGSPSNLAVFSDGSALKGLTLTVNYEASYTGFKNLIDYLASDTRLTSVQYATMNYDEENDTVSGSLTILRYILDSDLLNYYVPDVNRPSTGKPNIFTGGAPASRTSN